MASKVKIQRVERECSRSFYVNLPVVLVDAIGIVKGEVFEWTLEDKNTLVFKRVEKQGKSKMRSTSR